MFKLSSILMFVLYSFSSFAMPEKLALETKEKLLQMLQNENIRDISISFSVSKNNDFENYSDLKIENLDQHNRTFQTIIINQSNKEKITIPSRYKDYVEIPVFKMKITPGFLIEASDITKINFDASKISHETVTDENELLNKTPKTQILAYKPIKRDNIMIPSIINKNDTVTARYKKGNLKMTISAIALEKGAKGDLIRVQNTRSNAILNGIVKNNNLVEIQ